MNRSLFIILIPALLVAAGYIFILRMMGIAPGYSRFMLTLAFLFGVIYWLSRQSPRKAKSSRQ